MFVTFVGKCKDCEKPMEIVFNSKLNQGAGAFYEAKCPNCGSKISLQGLDRLYQMADKLTANSQMIENFQMDSIILQCLPTDPEYQRAQQSARLFLQGRLKELETEAKDHE